MKSEMDVLKGLYDRNAGPDADSIQLIKDIVDIVEMYDEGLIDGNRVNEILNRLNLDDLVSFMARRKDYGLPYEYHVWSFLETFAPEKLDGVMYEPDTLSWIREMKSLNGESENYIIDPLAGRNLFLDNLRLAVEFIEEGRLVPSILRESIRDSRFMKSYLNQIRDGIDLQHPDMKIYSESLLKKHLNMLVDYLHEADHEYLESLVNEGVFDDSDLSLYPTLNKMVALKKLRGSLKGVRRRFVKSIEDTPRPALEDVKAVSEEVVIENESSKDISSEVGSPSLIDDAKGVSQLLSERVHDFAIIVADGIDWVFETIDSGVEWAVEKIKSGVTWIRENPKINSVVDAALNKISEWIDKLDSSVAKLQSELVKGVERGIDKLDSTAEKTTAAINKATERAIRKSVIVERPVLSDKARDFARRISSKLGTHRVRAVEPRGVVRV